MIKNLFKKLLIKTGKSYDLDADIPNSLIVITLYKRAIMLLRGIFKTGQKVFVGQNTKIYNTKNIIFGINVTINQNCIIDGYSKQKTIFGDNVNIGAHSKLTSTSHLSKYGVGLQMGNNSAIGDFTHFGAAGGIDIGNDVIMGSFISFHSENHIFSDTTKLIREQGTTSKGIKIGNNVWVGAKVTFLDGSQIGNNSVVAAGAVVTDVFPDNCVVGGVPARILKNL